MQLQPLDDYNAGILSERQKNRFKLSGVQVGDFIERTDGKRARVTHVWEGDGIENPTAQTTAWSDTGEGGSFYLSSSGHLSYSGGLEAGVPITHLKNIGNNLGAQGRCWFFKRDQHQVHNGIDAPIWCKLFKLLDDTQAINKKIPARYLVVKNPAEFRGSIYTQTYTTFDGIERVNYSDNMPLADYLEQNTGLRVVDDAELTPMLAAYYDAQVTHPAQITTERYDDMLNVLPPCRWKTRAGIEAFHVSERLTGNLVSWFAHTKNGYFEFVDRADITEEYLINKMKGF
jgi:hypothetical protein